MFKIILFSALISFGISHADACSLFKLKPTVPDEIDFFIQTSKKIYLAEAVSKNKNGTVNLKVIETIKGAAKKNISIKATYSESSTEKDNTFNNHTDEDFWSSRYIGRVDDGGKCDFTPEFVKGKQYLIIVDGRWWFKKAELITEPTDKWYLKVKELIKPPEKAKK